MHVGSWALLKGGAELCRENPVLLAREPPSYSSHSLLQGDIFFSRLSIGCLRFNFYWLSPSVQVGFISCKRNVFISSLSHDIMSRPIKESEDIGKFLSVSF